MNLSKTFVIALNYVFIINSTDGILLINTKPIKLSIKSSTHSLRSDTTAALPLNLTFLPY